MLELNASFADFIRKLQKKIVPFFLQFSFAYPNLLFFSFTFQFPFFYQTWLSVSHFFLTIRYLRRGGLIFFPIRTLKISL